MPDINDLQRDSGALVESPYMSVRKTLEKQSTQLRNALPPGIGVKRFLRVIYTQLHKNPRLQECTKESLIASVFTAAERSIIPNGIHGALVPYWNGKKKCREAQFQSMFQGLISIAKKSGDVIDIWPATICENDEWRYELGLHPDLVHRPADGDRGGPLYYYATMELPNGHRTIGPGLMTVEEMERIKARSKSKDDGPWVTDEEAMCWKTVIKRNLKYIGVSMDLAAALEEDDDIEYGEIDVTAPAAESPEDEDEKTEERAIPKRLPEWPQWDEEKQAWVDSAGDVYNEEIHSKPLKCNESNGRFRRRRSDSGARKPEPEEPPVPEPDGQPGPDVPF